jgi:hypothetical protein
MQGCLNSFPNLALAIVATCLVSNESVLAQGAAAQEVWKVVAQSHVIVDGVPDVPVDEIEKANRSGNHDYICVAVRVTKCIKGDDCPETILIRYFTRPAWYSPSGQTLANLNRQKSVMFLVKADTGIYFVQTPKAIQSSSQGLIDRLSAEVSAQKKITKQFARYFRPQNEPVYTKVRALMESMLDRRTEEKAFADLEAIGQSAVPAMIMLMDDRRKLPLQEMSLRNGSGGFEAFRHYGPKVVTDAVTAILNQITGESFGETMNGGSERERKAAVDGWRVYLYRTHFGDR